MNDWLNNPNLNRDLLNELHQMTPEEANDAFYTNLSFGTGGMRGIVGAGTNRMNIYTLRRTNYGYGQFILKRSPNPSVVIAYDSRRMSLEFAYDCAQLLATLGIKVYLFTKITPTPELSFSIRHLHASGGIVITASHNPPQYNGYKIYDADGCQLVPNLVDAVLAEIDQAPSLFDITVKDLYELKSQGLIEDVKEEVDEAYLQLVKSIRVFSNLKPNINIIYTPLHGTGGYLAQRLLTDLGYDFKTVSEQMIPDANFSTIKSPNPEDPKAFDLALKLAKDYPADLIIATDPDADRLGIAVLHQGTYHFLTGNETGAIFLSYLCHFRPLKNGVVFDTIVTSDLGSKIAKYYGLKVVSTLTGFKYIGEQAKRLEKTNEVFFFGYEESYGYVIKDFVRDKDSLQALTLASEIVNYYKTQNKTLIDVLGEIYHQFGYHLNGLFNFSFPGSEGMSQMESILNYFRNHDINIEWTIKEDYLTSQRMTKDKTCPLTLPTSNVIKFILPDESWFVLRPSGTEPKMKLYIATVSKNKPLALQRQEEIKNIIMNIIERVNK